MRPRGGGQRDQAAPLVERGGDRLLDQHVDAVLEQRRGDRRSGPASARRCWRSRCGRTAPRRRSTAGAPTVRGDLRGAVAVEVDDADQLDAGQAGVLLGVEGAEVADADDGGAHRAQPPSARTPTMARSAAAAAASSASRSSSRVLPASSASTAMPASRQTATVAGPTAGTSKRRSWPGLLTFTATAPPRAEGAAAAQRRVGALERLDGEHHARLHHHRLADVPGADALGDRQAVLGCRAHCAASGWRAVSAPSGVRIERQEQRRLDDRDALALELLGDAAQQRVVAPLRQPGEEALGALVGSEVLQQRRLADAAGHDRAPHAVRPGRCG